MSDKIHPLDAIRALEESSALKACIEALERENAALRDDDAKMQLLHRQEDQLIAAERKLIAAEADKARLSEALACARGRFINYGWSLKSETIHQIDAALSGSGSGWRVPDGWKLVPVEPTEEMYRAAYKEQDDAAIHNYGAAPTFDDYWAAALEAAPAAPQQGGE